MTQFLTIPQAAESLQVSHWTVRRWINTEVIKAVKFGGRIRIPSDSIEQGGKPVVVATKKRPVSKATRRLELDKAWAEFDIRFNRTTRLARAT